MSFFAIVVPMYNEEKVALKSIQKILKSINKIKPKGHLIVINDGSTDRTQEICEKIKCYNFHLVTHKINKGYGASTQTALKFSKKKFKYLIYMDSDLTNSPKDIPKFVKKMKQNFDLIKGSRFIKGGGYLRSVPINRRIISYIGNKIAKLLFNTTVSDITNGFRAVKIIHLENFFLSQNDFSIIMEEFYHLKKKKIKFVEIPAVLGARTNSESKFNYNLMTYVNYLKYPIKYFLKL
jgi:dolichol-phosphate mannosyltransferase